MAMNTVIREKRRELGLTQEQVADRLNVSAPAVNKWEKGISFPDTGLLAPLARLLKIDLNALFEFREKLSDQEVALFGNQLFQTAEQEGIEAAVETAEEKLREYPDCGELAYTSAAILKGALILTGAGREERAEYEKKFRSWYDTAVRNGSEELRERAAYMLAGEYLGEDNLERAEEILEAIPERRGNKLLLQAELLIKKERQQEAVRLLEQGLAGTALEVQNLLLKLAQAENSRENFARAEQIGEQAKKVIEALELWEYGNLLIPLETALASKDGGRCVALIERLLEAAEKPWSLRETVLYCDLEEKQGAGLEKFAFYLLKELEEETQYGFLREREDFRCLLAKWKEKIG